MSLKPAVNNVSFNKKSNSTDTDKTSGKDNATFVVNKLSYNAVKQTFAYNVTYK